MTPRNRIQVHLEPLVSWPRDMTVDRLHLVEVDLRLAGPAETWPYEEEEVAFTCMLDGAADFSVAAIRDASIVVHRFGGSYGPAGFAVTPRDVLGNRSLWLTIVTLRGLPVSTHELVVRIHQPGRESARKQAQAIVSVPRPPQPRATPRPQAPEPPPQADPRAPVFYLSYARADHGVTNARFFDFFEELSENVAQLVSVPAGIGTGYMDRSIASGTQWTPELLNAIGTCQVFVALLSAPYINSLWCAQEWSAFSQREVVPRSGEAAQNTAIIPVIWAPFAEKVTPPTIDAIQRFSPNGLRDLDIVRQYHVYGMQGLMQAGLTGSYQTVVWELARQIATVHRSHWVRPQTFHENELHDIFRE